MFDLASAKNRLNITDTLQDGAVQGFLNASLALAERYCSRGFLYKSERVHYYDGHYETLPLPRYPVDKIIKVSVNDKRHVHKQTGIIAFDRPVFADTITVDYSGGYKTIPSDLELALWEIFDNFWGRHTASPSSGTAAVGGGPIKSITSDGATVSFDTSSGAATSSTPTSLNLDTGLPYSAQSILDLYVRGMA